MGYLQTLVNGIVLGALYACLAVGFSLVWGVLNIVNMLHGSLIVFGGYLTYFAWHSYGIHPLIALPMVALFLYSIGYVTQLLAINRVINQPVLTTMTLTFGLDLILYNFMTVYYTATPRRVSLDFGIIDVGGIVVPVDRLVGMALALILTAMLYLVLRLSRIGRAIVAVRMDSAAAALMGIKVSRIYAITFGIGALMAGATGAIFAMVYPVTTNLTGTLSRQGVRHLRHRRPRQRPGRAGRRHRAGHHREFCRPVLRTTARAYGRLCTDAGPAGGQADGPDRHQGV